jgi:hypothetical protein
VTKAKFEQERHNAIRAHLSEFGITAGGLHRVQ